MAAPTASNRLICAHCGANNFDTQAACWKCGVPLGAAAAPAPPVAAPVPSAGAPLHASPRPSSADRPAVPLAAPVRPQPSVDPAVANWAAIVGGLLMPAILFPVGFVFLMLDDRRKLELGRISLIASVAGTVLHLLGTAALIGPAISGFIKAGPGMVNWAGQARETMENRPPDLNAPTDGLRLEGLRPPPAQPGDGLFRTQ